DWPRERLAESDRIAAALADAHADALSMRVLGNLQLVAATVDVEISSRRERLTIAGRASAADVLSSRGDAGRFANAIHQALALDLGEGGDYLLAQRTLNAFRGEIIRRLQINVDVDKPEEAQGAIAGWIDRNHTRG